MEIPTDLRELLARLPGVDSAELEAIEDVADLVRFLEGGIRRLQGDLRQKEGAVTSAQEARGLYESAAQEADTLRRTQTQRHRDFALYLGRYLNDEIDIPPEVPEELEPFGEALLAGIEELREQARRPLPEDTQKVVFMPGDTQLDVILEVILQSAENENPGKYFLDHLSRQFVIPEGYDSRLVRLGAFFERYTGVLVELDHAKGTVAKQRETLGRAAADLEELHGLRERLPELEGRIDGMERKLTETERYWEAETRARIAADGEAKSAKVLLAEKGGELELLRGQVRDFEELQRDQADERVDLERSYRTLEEQLQEATEHSRQQEVELQTEIAITRADRDRFKDYFHRQIQRVLRFVQELRTQRGRESGLQKAVDEERGRYQALEGQFQQATGDLRQREGEIVGLTGNLERRTEEYQTEQRQRRLAEGQAEKLKRTLRSVTTEREAARGALQGQLDEVHRLEAVQGYNERLKQFLRRGAQRLRESTINLRAERRLSAGLPERMEELIRGGEAQSHPYDAVVAQRDEAQEMIVDLTSQARAYEKRLASAQRLRAVAEGERNDLQDRYGERGLHLKASRRRVRELSGTYRKLSARLHTQRQVSSTAIDRIFTLHARLARQAEKLQREQRTGMEVLDRTVVQYEQLMAEQKNRLGEEYAQKVREGEELYHRIDELTAQLRVAGEEIGRYHAQRAEQDLANALEEGVREELEERLRRAESAYDAFSQFVAEPLEHAVQVVERMNPSLRGRLEGDTAVRKSIARQLRKRERQVAQLSRQLDRLDVEYTVLHVEQEDLSEQLKRVEAELESARGNMRELTAHYEGQMGVYAGFNRDLEQQLANVIIQLEEANERLESYQGEEYTVAARRLAQKLLMATTQPARERPPLVVEVVEKPEGVSPVGTEPVLDDMVLSVEPVTPPLEQPIPPIRSTRTYSPRDILRSLAQVGAIAGAMVTASVATYYIHDALTSPPAVQQVTIPMQIPIQNAADLLRYKSALESAYLEGIHHREGRDAILQRLQETAQRHPLQNDALQPEYESQLTHMRRIVGITHK